VLRDYARHAQQLVASYRDTLLELGDDPTTLDSDAASSDGANSTAADAALEAKPAAAP
jgi:hypothetical protein